MSLREELRRIGWRSKIRPGTGWSYLVTRPPRFSLVVCTFFHPEDLIEVFAAGEDADVIDDNSTYATHCDIYDA